MVLHFQRLDAPAQYRDVEDLDAELREFVKNLPPHFSMTNPDKSLDSGTCPGVIYPRHADARAALWYLPVHRYYIQTEILHFTIILHVSGILYACTMLTRLAPLALAQASQQPVQPV